MIELFKTLSYNDAFLIFVASIVFTLTSIMLGNLCQKISQFNDITTRIPLINDFYLKIPFIKKPIPILKKRINLLFIFANFVFWIGCSLFGLSITILLYHALASALPVVFG